MDEYQTENQRLWDAWTEIHEGSSFYDLEGFKRGGVRILPDERDEVGDVRGRSLLHLQCHFGIDTLSWARLGATVTGADFSERAIALARSVAEEIDVPATFVRSNLFDLPANLEAPGGFDIVYTSRGVLGWMPDIRAWARVAAHFVRPGGFFYIREIHPVAFVFQNEGVEPGELRLMYPYWSHQEPLRFDVIGSYADPDAPTDGLVEYGWDQSLGEVVTSLIDAGLRIEFLHEFPWCAWKLDFLVEREDGRFYLPGELDGRLPISFSLKATKPEEG